MSVIPDEYADHALEGIERASGAWKNGAVGCVQTYRVNVGSMTKTPSVIIFRTACASATLLRHVLLPTLNGLQGPERMTVKAIVYAMTVQATIYRAIRNPIRTSIRW